MPYHLSDTQALRLNSQTFPVTGEESQALAAAGVKVTHQELIDSPASRALLPSMDALLVVSAKVPRSVIEQLKQCRVIVRYGSGTDNIDVQCATELGIVVANVPDFCLSEVPDHTMALLLATARKLLSMDRHTRSGRWQARVQEKVTRIAGKTLGLIGFGNIAQRVARRAAAFDLEVIAYDPFLDRQIAQRLGVRAVGLEKLLRQSDFVSLHLPLNEKTRHLIGEQQLRLMKPEAILINTSRGGVLDESAFVRAISEGWIAGAGIDVYENLPMFDLNPPLIHHPFFELENVLLTPHSAGCSKEALEQLMREGAEEAIAVLGGHPPHNWVNPDVLSRSPLHGTKAAR